MNTFQIISDFFSVSDGNPYLCLQNNLAYDEKNIVRGGAERILLAKLYLPGLLADTQFGNRMKNAVHRIVLWITTQHFLCLLWWIRGESGGKP